MHPRQRCCQPCPISICRCWRHPPLGGTVGSSEPFGGADDCGASPGIPCPRCRQPIQAAINSDPRALLSLSRLQSTAASMAVRRASDLTLRMLKIAPFATRSIRSNQCCSRPPWSCGATGVPLKKCSVCAVAAYCGTGCQKADWKVHKGQCAGLKAGATGSGSTAAEGQ